MENKKTFAIIGLGYIAERHIKAIQAIGGKLVHVYDINNKAGFIDKYFIETYFCDSEEEFFERNADYYVICTPNYLHYSHIKMVKHGKIICEKPLVLTMNELEDLPEVNCILQLRHFPIQLSKSEDKISIRYVTPRGNWYHKSWKGDKKLSGGIATNIGVHLFDLMCFSFGEHLGTHKIYEDENTMQGVSRFADVDVEWFLSTGWMPTERTVTQNGVKSNLIEDFEDLHIRSYQDIIAGKGWKAKDCTQSIQIVNSLR